MNKSLQIAPAACLLSGCGHVGNSLVGGDRGFRSYAQSWVGKEIDGATGMKDTCSGGGEHVADTDIDGLTRERELVWKCWSDQVGSSSNSCCVLSYRVSDFDVALCLRPARLLSRCLLRWVMLGMP